MSSKFLLLTATTSVGVLGGTGGFAYWYSQPSNLGDLLSKEGKKLLDTKGSNHDKEWTELAKKHKGDKSLRTNNSVEILPITGLTINGSDATIEFVALKNKCKLIFETPITKGQEFEKAKENAINWCTENSPLLPVKPST